MSYINKISLLLCFSVSLSQLSFGQDFHFSQYDVAALNTNPALTGMFEGKHRLHTHYRTQWSAVATKPFTTGLISFDSRINNKWSFGIQLLNYRAGAGAYNAAQVLPSLSYSIPLSKNKFHRITLGVAAGAFHKTFDQNALTWGAQYEATAQGGQFNTATSSGETFQNSSVLRPDFNAGFIYFFAAPGARVNPFVGGSAFHLSTPEESFLGSGNRLPMRYLGHAGARIGINQRLSIIPKVYYQYQDQAMELTVSALAHYYLKGPDVFLIGGFTYRNADAAIAEIGCKWASWQARLSYDFNVSTLKVATNGRGATELSLTYIMFKTETNPIPTCPRL
ncbi:MAG: PorP/SprF family type IX secretion system membrane protein [Brumimicrobium sp.]|nr:PorP/SprF family type IX secretion system membrane protein [Brumimicrobium sp.]